MLIDAMRTRLHFTFLLLLAVLAGVSGCRKEKDPTPLERLPPATTTGANTWGCLVNGEAWANKGEAHVGADWTVPDGMSVGMSFSTRYVRLVFPDSTNRYRLTAGDYPLVRNAATGSHASVHIGNKIYNGSNLVNGMAHLSRVDRQAGVVSGTFEFTIVDQPGDTLQVTNGRFDIGDMAR